MSLASDFMLPKMLTWGHLLAQGRSADFNPARDYVRELDPPDAILGSPVALAIWGTASAWPTKLILSEFRQPQPSDVPTLLVSGSVDFSTPREHEFGVAGLFQHQRCERQLPVGIARLPGRFRAKERVGLRRRR